MLQSAIAAQAKQAPQAKDKSVINRLTKELRIATNRGGSRVFSSLQEVREFARHTARDVACLTAVAQSSSEDESFIVQMWGLVNDLAFQLEQAVDLIAGAETA
ncbi:hypothetical protein [Cupriavidus taiwanensis]|uniref:hypothetical protein n=1 Tax=Cupriavidus taiwanensis TaxID=164546 RepID=UPI000E1A81F7|nr:hypothetical protein [Cupriavidus taiwanensis]SOY56027.1 hypothetical protein CBM2585_A60232 [Cupriavidus taiwanensis]